MMKHVVALPYAAVGHPTSGRRRLRGPPAHTRFPPDSIDLLFAFPGQKWPIKSSRDLCMSLLNHLTIEEHYVKVQGGLRRGGGQQTNKEDEQSGASAHTALQAAAASRLQCRVQVFPSMRHRRRRRRRHSLHYAASLRAGRGLSCHIVTLFSAINVTGYLVFSFLFLLFISPADGYSFTGVTNADGLLFHNSSK